VELFQTDSTFCVCMFTLVNSMCVCVLTQVIDWENDWSVNRFVDVIILYLHFFLSTLRTFSSFSFHQTATLTKKKFIQVCH